MSRRIVFPKGQVRLNVIPWADVYVGTTKLGRTPMPPLKLYAGNHTLRLVNPQHQERVVEIVLRGGETQKVVVNLKNSD